MHIPMDQINWVDYSILGTIAFSVVVGIVRGFVREAMSLLTWIIAIAVGILYCEPFSAYFSKNHCDPWIDNYIFPHGMLPSLQQLGKAFERKFKVEDFQNFGAYYDKTLMSWYKNLNDNWPELKQDYSEAFRRMMNYYLLSCAGSFRARGMQLWQFVLTQKGMLHGYQSFR